MHELAQYCMNLSQWFTYETEAFFQNSDQPHYFFTTLKSRKAFIASRSKVWLSALFFICTCACTHLVLSNDTKLLLKFTELEIKSVCVPGHGIKEPVYVLCCQSNEALEKTEVVPIVNAGSDILSYEYAPTSGATPRCSHITIDTIHSVDVKRLRIRMIYGEFVNQSLNRSRAQLQERTGCT